MVLSNSSLTPDSAHCSGSLGANGASAEGLESCPASTPSPSLWQVVAEDSVSLGREASQPGLQALLVDRSGVVARMKVEPPRVRAALGPPHRMPFRTARNFHGIQLPSAAKVARREIPEHRRGSVVHGAPVIGDDCVLRERATVRIRTLDKREDAPILGHGVNVGAGTESIGRVLFRSGERIRADAVVPKGIPANTHAAGVPAPVVNSPETNSHHPARALHSADAAAAR